MVCLEELKTLNKISGSLYISGLKNIGDVKCWKADLASIPNLHMVILNFEHNPINFWETYNDDHKKFWKAYYVLVDDVPELHLAVNSNKAIQNENDEKIQEDVLKSLQPHKNLKVLCILNYRGINFPSWLLHSSLVLKPPTFISLEVLQLTNIPNLVEWEASDGHFPCLKKLSIDNCPRLLEVTTPQEVKELRLEHCGCQVVNFSSRSKIQLIWISNCTELSCVYYKNGDLSVLRSIRLFGCPNLWAFSAILEEPKRMDTKDCGFQEIGLALESKNNIGILPISFLVQCWKIPIQYLYSSCTGSVSLSGCPNLRLFSAIPVEACTLEIDNCGFRDMMFPSRCMQIKVSQCPELTSIYWRNGSLNSLNQMVKFDNCPRLGYIRVPAAAKSLHIASCGVQEIIFPSQSMIQILHIKHCLNLFSIHWKEVPFFREILLEGCHGLSSMSAIPSEIHQLELFECGLHEIMFPIQCKIASAHILRCLNLTSLHFPEDLPLFETFSIKSCHGFVEVLTIPSQVKELDMSDCSVPEIHLLPKSRLHKLTITRCVQLAAIKGLHAQCLLTSLHISRCPILQFSMDGLLLPMMEMFHMYECPERDFIREGKSHSYEVDAMADSLIASDDVKILLDHSARWSIPLLKNSELQFLKEDSSKVLEAIELSPLSERSCQYIKLHLPSLVKLEIRNCQAVISVAGLDNLKSLKRLVISHCPELCEWKDTTLPSAVWFLELISCSKLCCAPLQCQPVENYLETVKVFISECPLLGETCNRITEHIARSEQLMLFWPRQLLM